MVVKYVGLNMFILPPIPLFLAKNGKNQIFQQISFNSESKKTQQDPRTDLLLNIFWLKWPKIGHNKKLTQIYTSHIQTDITATFNRLITLSGRVYLARLRYI